LSYTPSDLHGPDTSRDRLPTTLHPTCSFGNTSTTRTALAGPNSSRRCASCCCTNAQSGGRTHMTLRSTDFESVASADSAIWAHERAPARRPSVNSKCTSGNVCPLPSPSDFVFRSPETLSVVHWRPTTEGGGPIWCSSGRGICAHPPPLKILHPTPKLILQGKVSGPL
jgi:hypothetical protein